MNEEQKNLLELIEKKENKSRMRAIIYSIVPIILAVILIIYSSGKIKQLNEIKIERNKYIHQTDSLKQKVHELQVQLENSTNFVKYIHEIDWMDAKKLASQFPKQARLLELILDMKREKIKWKLGSINPNVGFDSPSFATYFINHYAKTNIDINKRYNLINNITPKNSPEIGDLIFYDGGYTMFYFKDSQNRPFCIGMTPAGIISVDIHFGPKLIGYGDIKY